MQMHDVRRKTSFRSGANYEITVSDVDMIEYVSSLEGISEHNLHGFFVGWPNPPDESTFFKILENSDEIVLAVETSGGQVVGFITAITDKTLMAFIPLLEVLPTYKERGIGGELVERMLGRLSGFYGIDLLCDRELQNYYKRFGMQPATGMVLRNYQNQSGNT